MNKLNLNHVTDYVNNNIDSLFHNKKLDSLKNFKLNELLERKNPYLFKAKGIYTATEFLQTVMDAYISSQEETMFGDFLETLAIFICGKVYGGKKSRLVGIDLEFERDNVICVVSIKSGPNWGNSDQINKMIINFHNAEELLQREHNKEIKVINGCCYGKDSTPQKVGWYKITDETIIKFNNPKKIELLKKLQDNTFYSKEELKKGFTKEELRQITVLAEKKYYEKICGQRFWEFISDNEDLYTDIIEPLGYKAKEKTEKFKENYSIVINQFTGLFLRDYCIDGRINWEKIVKLNSSKEKKSNNLFQ